MNKVKVLFVCVHNSARSQMAEAFLNTMAGDKFYAESAGMDPGVLNPLAAEAMREIGIDISQNKTKSVFDKYKQGELFSYVIAVCDEAQTCPVFPGLRTETIHWNIGDPESFTGTHDEKMARMRPVRDEIKRKVEEFIQHIAAEIS